MNGELAPFHQFDLERTLIMRLEEMNKKYPIGPQNELIEAMTNKNCDIILRAGKQTGKSTGYLIPIVNEAIKREREKDTKKCVGLIISWSSDIVKDIAKLANEICSDLPISIISGQKRSLNIEINNEYIIMVTKACLLLNNFPSVQHLFEGLNYVVVEQASCFASIDKNKVLLEILDKVRMIACTNVTTVLSCIDYRGTENILQTHFLKKELLYISFIKYESNKCLNLVSKEKTALDGQKANEYFKRLSKMNLDMIFINNIDIFLFIQKLIIHILRKNDKNIVIYIPTTISFLIIKYKLSILGIPFKISNADSEEKHHKFVSSFGNVLICFDDIEEELIDNLKKKIVIHYFLPPTTEMYNKRIEIQKNSGEYLKSIILDDKTRLTNFLKNKKIMF